MKDDLRSMHDAELATIDVDTAGRALRLRFGKADGTRVDFRFEKILHLKINGVFPQNVASRVLLTPSTRFEPACVRTVLEWLCTFDNGRVDARLVDVATTGIENGTLKLFHVEPSVGAEVAVLSASVTIHENPEEYP